MMRRLRADDGFTILEVVVALTVLAVSAAAFATTTGHGFRLVGTSKERQTAVSLANRWMEQARAVPYSGLALDAENTTFAGAGTPDEDVSGTTYNGEFGPETLIVETDGALLHTDTENPNGLLYTLYRYVTWVGVGSEDEAYKRVTVVATWDGSTTDAANPASITMSTIISADGIAFSTSGSTVTTSPTATTTTTAASTTTTTVSGACDGDTTAPTGTIRILAGTGANTGYSASSTVNLTLTASDPCGVEMAFSNDDVNYSENQLFETTEVWGVEPGDGNRTVYVRYTDGAGNASVGEATIRIDGTVPTTPGSFTATAKTGPKRVVLEWTASTDNDTLIGYRIYVAKGSGSFQNQPSGVTAPCSTNPCSWTHTGVKNGEVNTYYVVAYDAAGNESAETTHKTVTV